MSRFSRKHLIAMVLGVAVAGLPLLALNYWLDRIIDRQGRHDADSSARRLLTLAESRTQQVIAALDNLAARGVDHCSPELLATMRFVVFTIIPIKEVSVVSAGGATECNHLGVQFGERKMLYSEPLAGAKGYSLDIIEVGDDMRMLRFRRTDGGIAALVPIELFLPKVSTDGKPFAAAARLLSASGIELAESGNLTEQLGTDGFFAHLNSEHYGYHVQILIPRSALSADHADLKWITLFATNSVAFLLIGFTVLRPKRKTQNPVAEIEQALKAGEFVPYYQPIVDIRSGQLRGAEVLVRWRKSDGTLIPPGAFIPLAESSGLIRALTIDLMRRVCVEAGAAVGRRPGMKITFNFAAQLFADESIIRDVEKIFSGSPIQFSQVVLELTERDPIENFTETRRVIAALQGLGLRIAIDDVGTGHSGLSYMLKLGVDIIKIDKMFVDALGTDKNSITIVETLIDLAHNMRMDIVAEGVENFEQVVQLRDLGIRSAQGYVFAPPLPGSSFLQLIEAIDPLPAAAAATVTTDATHAYLAARDRLSA